MLRKSGFVLRRQKAHSRLCAQNLKRSSKAFLAPLGSLGLLFWLGAAVVSRSQDVRPEKCWHSLATSFGDTRAGSLTAHSKVAPGSKFTHCTHERRSTWHFGHLLRDMISESTMVPQREHRATWRWPIIRGLRAPSDEIRRAPAGAPGSRSGLPPPPSGRGPEPDGRRSRSSSW